MAAMAIFDIGTEQFLAFLNRYVTLLLPSSFGAILDIKQNNFSDSESPCLPYLCLPTNFSLTQLTIREMSFENF